MTITLPPEQEAWIRAKVAAGEFASVEAGARQLLDERIAEIESGVPADLDWAKPFVDEGLAQFERGEFVTLEEHKAHNAALLASLR